MESRIDRVQFNRIDVEEQKTVQIEGGFDSFERIDVRESDAEGPNIHLFKIEKKTEVFEILMHWAVKPDDEKQSSDELKEMAKKQLRTESSYLASLYLKSMDLPPLQGLFMEQMVVEMVPGTDEADER